MAYRKISLARNIHCLPNFFLNLLPDQHVYVVKNMCICTHFWPCTLEYELPLLPYNTISETFLHKIRSGAKGWFGYLSLGASLTVTRWIHNIEQNILHSFCQTRSSRNPTYFQIFFFVSFLEEVFIRNIVIILYKNYTI